MQPLIINLQANPDAGEDDHFIEQYGQSYVMAVFDGLGGRSGGKIASHLARQATKEFFNSLTNQNCEFDEQKVKELRHKIQPVLQKKAGDMGSSQSRLKGLKSSRLKGKLTGKKNCSTLALASISVSEKIIYLDIAWIGDSRIYFLSPQQGLQQLTKDDLKEY